MKASVLYNQLINIGWTLLGFAPVLVFWVKYYQPQLLLLFVVLSLLPFLIPASVLQKFIICRQRSWYIRTGVKIAQGFTQNGAYINRWLRRSAPAYSVIGSRKDLKSYRVQMLIFEKYHLACFVFFNLSLFLALIRQELVLSMLILALNILYNVYPILIQHYNKLRLL